MSPVGRFRRRALLLRPFAIAAAFSLFAVSSFAGVVEIPVLDAPVGSGAPSAASAPGAASLAPTLSVSAAPVGAAALQAPPAAVAVPLPVAVLAPPAASAAAPLAAPAAALVVAQAAPLPVSRAPGSFGKRVSPPASDAVASGAAAARETGEQGWAQSSALFDLSAVHTDAAASPAVTAGLPENLVGKTLKRLRLSGARGDPGPGSIPGMSRVEWAGAASHGNSGETAKVLVGGKPWYLKRLGSSPDPVIGATPVETRAGNEAGMAAVLRSDRQLSRSFSVSPRVSVFRDGEAVFVLSEGLPSVGDGESRRQELSAEQRADAAIVQLVLGQGDMHGANILPLGGGHFGLIDFEKLSRAPLETATPRQIDEQVMIKNFPLVDRLSANDPALYRARFQSWKDDYDAGGRARMDAALAGAGWSRPQREVYLTAVDRNAETYLERLQPYLDYANGWHKRILEARAEAARREAAPRPGFFGSLFGGGGKGR
ncbi:MAG: hypothetical protein ACHQ51_07980 [Elusimicrobiota bacterium]